MVTMCWAAKGGSGTTVVASAIALTEPSRALLVDLDGEVPRALGLSPPERPGLAAWLGSEAPEAHLDDLLLDAGEGLRVLPWHTAAVPTTLDPARAAVATFADADPERRRRCISWLRSRTDERVVVDAGTGEPPADLAEAADTRLLVTRACYLGVQRAIAHDARPTGIVLVDEPGRSLARRDIERSLGASIVTSLGFDPAVARAVDAGLLVGRLPRGYRRELRRAS